MKLLIASIGRLKPSPEKDLCEQYIKQCGWPITVKEYEPKKKDISARIAEETQFLAATCETKNARTIALDERGKMMPSRDFAALLQNWQDEGVTQVQFLIGGADGLDADLRKKADRIIAFSPMTWPHKLARAMLCEQLYRAWSITQGHPYHRE